MDARSKQEYRDETYRILISEQLRLLPKLTSLKTSYADVLKKEQEEREFKKETRTGREVADAAAAKMGIKINWGGET